MLFLRGRAGVYFLAKNKVECVPVMIYQFYFHSLIARYFSLSVIYSASMKSYHF